MKRIMTIKKKAREFTILHPYLYFFCIVLFLLLLALLGCWVAAELDQGVCMWPNDAFSYLYLRWDAESGLSLLVGYLGAASTIVLGLLALRFSYKVEERELVARLRNFKVLSVCLYDMYEDFIPKELRYSDSKRYQFLLKIVLSGNSSDYDIKAREVLWGECNDQYEMIDERGLSDCRIYVENAIRTTIYIYFNEFKFVEEKDADETDMRKRVSFFYHIRDYEPLLQERYMRHQWIRMSMCMQEKAWMKRQKPHIYDAEFELLVENRQIGETKEVNIKIPKYLNLYEISHNIQIIGRKL